MWATAPDEYYFSGRLESELNASTAASAIAFGAPSSLTVGAARELRWTCVVLVASFFITHFGVTDPLVARSCSKRAT
jgi:hypothetical protein